MLVLTDSVKWVGAVCLMAVAGTLVALRGQDRPLAWIIGLLALSGFLAPAEQARIHTTVSLSKHLDFGAWFAAVAAGYLLERLTRVAPARAAHAAGFVVPVAAVVTVLAVGQAQSQAFFRVWPDSSRINATLAGFTGAHPGPYLVEDYNVPAYYLQNSVPVSDWTGTYSFAYHDPVTKKLISGLPAYAAAIKHGYFSLIALDFTGGTAATDQQIAADIARSGGYKIITEIPAPGDGYVKFGVWARTS